MEQEAVLNQAPAVATDDVLKLTALVYFQEALYKQQYEGCKELATAARKFGAQQAEVDAVIAAYLRDGGPAGQSGKNRIKQRPGVAKQKP